MDTNTISMLSPSPNTGTLSGGIEFDSNGNVVDVNGQPLATVPEPSTMTIALVCGALLGLPALGKRLLRLAA